MSLVDQLRRAVVVAVLRAPDAESAKAGVAALVAGGVRCVEITYSTPGAARVVRDLRAEYADDVLVGAGTVTTPRLVAESVEAGAQFLVSPGSPAPLVEAMRASGTPFVLGALTPTEVMVAAESGADVVKVFPGSVGGPSYLRSLRGPFPDLPLMPTGGVTVDNARDWLDAGAVCLGAGGELVSAVLLAARDGAEITKRAQAFMAAARQDA